MPVAIELLKVVPLFQLLDDDELRELAAHIDERSYAAGQTVFKAGDPGGEMHVVLEGYAETFVVDHDGHRVTIDECDAGDIFGELSLLDSEPRSASVVATRALRTCVIERSDLAKLFARRPMAAMDVLQVLGRRIRRTDEMLRERALRNPNLVIEEQSSLGDWVADVVATFGGSWMFIHLSIAIILGWIALNWWVLKVPFDPAPFIGLNLVLSLIAALQAPVIMMSQNRQDAKDRVRSELEYQVNVRAELGVRELQQELGRLKENLMELLVQRGAKS
ncbi:MAG TPA: DUF1003 domain-containing protein [Pirellulales bacterium]|jgi:uncharacterized membrane protein|nr:DUF1003 domain-containing protein [Pirellulales bacterium]